MIQAKSRSHGHKGVRPRSPRGEGDLLRTEILDAAEAILIEVGDEERVSIRAIADSVGVTPPSIYRHFTDKARLLHEVCERRFKDLNDAFVAAEESSTHPVGRLRSLGRAYGEFALQHPEHYRVLMMTSSSTDVAAEMKQEDSQGAQAFRHLVDAVVACAQSQRIQVDDPVTTAVVLWSGMHGLVSLLITSPSFPWPAEAPALIEAVLDAQLRTLGLDPSSLL